ncbi:MAG: O-methyltransferase family 3 [uncultured bacterium]|nr:MAG: O-methyltransferase family 3 [uncultured bacterium]OGT15614.1 MAG: SAM-dependent methyltransferase [Gammaproteobacteria bacterium RIFCSPHIGHO2_02_FULL_38_33]OGT23447.1 MAG: SAM-dependent methyltransferase [Gammaproteobacteria bacterium RIFCSPHIGHO2_12_38_15]OGT68305.1 MAG: SAM-dependent methyltransferase [Gammaproteobacteria bacterium RIFCSPLOWO2_02_FULL_38_11]OGT77523.1 MAG: SAM-dependent methyltransferase [Gammaproteobacteria bacterium RIFCSPLOWO2_12_FULL_38_14]
MSTRTLPLTDSLYAYLLQYSLREPPLFKELREETAKLPSSACQISPEQGQFMGLLIKLLNAKKAIEIGVYTGYSSLCVAQALPSTGKLIACDISEDWTQLAKHYWKLAQLENKIDFRLAPAADTLEKLLENNEQDSFDFIFIDADKENYSLYYEKSLKLLRKGGIIAIDNVLWDGAVADHSKQDSSTCAIRALNEKVLHDDRVDISLVPIADGLTLALKK